MSQASPSMAAFAASYVKQFGMHLVPLPPKTKRPVAENWGNELLSTKEAAATFFERHPDWNVGVALGPSQLCSLDIDDYDAAKLIFEEFGWSLDDLIESHPTIQGKAPGFRVMFRVQEGMTLPYHNLTWPRQDDPKKRFTVFEIRAAAEQARQDVLPPSIHPDTGKPYVWLTSPKGKEGIPVPPDYLLQVWANWDQLKPQFQSVCPWAEKPAPRAARQPAQQPEAGQSVIDNFNAANGIEATLERYGYTRQGKRYLSPCSQTKLPGVNVFPDQNKCFIHHASDPLCSNENNQPVGPFDLFVQWEHGGDIKKATRAAADALGMRAKRPAPPPAPPANVDPETGEILSPANDNAKPETEGMTAEAAERSGFTILGYDRDVIYIFPHEAKQIKALSKGDLTENGLLSIARLEYWLHKFPKKGGFDKTAAVDWLFRTAYGRGVFDPDRIRGRGAWLDLERIVFHLGDRLHVDGSYTPITRMNSRFIYQAERPFPRFDDVEPLSSEEGEELLRLAGMFRWSVPASAALLAGWCMLAPVCGALQWRPHIWITGGAGSGKSTVINRYAQALVGMLSVFAQGNSTEAGLRQTLRGDALPVLVDEGEQNNERETARMQAVLSLIRQASSESGAKTYKGTTAGTGMQFHIRSMFCLASIQVGIQQQADRERLTILAMREKPEGGAGEQDAKQWLEIKAALYKLERDTSFSRRLLHRTVSMMPVVLASIEVFVQAAAEHFGNQRTGDQYGTLLAGAWCLTSSRVPTVKEAAEAIASFDWNEYTESSKGNDSERALRTLLDSRVRTSGGSEFTVFELVDRVADLEMVPRSSGDLPACQMDIHQCQAALQRYGMKVIKKQLMLASSSEALGRLFSGTQFAADYRGLLSRVPCISKSNEPAWIAGKTVKCLGIPLADIV